MKTLVKVPFKATAVAARGVATGLVALALASSGCTQAPASGSESGSLTATTSAAPLELNVSAAASLKKVLTDTAPAFETSSGAKVVLNFGASGQLVKQIEGGAPVDVFVSASPSAVTTLAGEGLVSAEESETVAGNTLVVLVPQGNPASVHAPQDLLKVAKLTTGDPAVAPHGQKAVEWLSVIGLWEKIAPKLVYAANAAQTDDYVARGEVDAGVGFASDAKGRTDIEVAYTVPDGTINPITYVAAPAAASKQQELAKAYLAYLMSPEMQQAFVDAGFKQSPALAK